MKITPIEIRQHTFEKGLRGYKPEDVDAFLVSLSQEWERITSEHKMLKMQLELAEKELGKLKEFEMTLFRTLKTAEESSAQIADQANKVSEGHINEAKQKADEILADARKRTVLMVKDAENQSRFLKDNILNDLKALEHDFKALEGYKENLAVQIRALAGNALDSVDRFEKKFVKQNLKGKIDEVASQIDEELKMDSRSQREEPAVVPSPEPVPVVSSAPDPTPVSPNVPDLPPLAEREMAIPEAIPFDKAFTDKLTESVQTTYQEPTRTIASEPPIAERMPTKLVPEEEVPQPELTIDEPTEVVKPKKGGSFFDQI